MPSSLISIPMWIPNGFGASDGIVRVYDTELVLEFEAKDGLMGLFKLGVKQIAIPFDEIESVSFRAGLFENVLTIATKTLSSTSGVPGSRRGIIQLHVSRADRMRAKEAESMLSFGLAQRDMRGLIAGFGRRYERTSTPEDAL